MLHAHMQTIGRSIHTHYSNYDCRREQREISQSGNTTHIHIRVYTVSFAKTTHIKHKTEEKKTKETGGASEKKHNILIRRGTTVKR